MGKDKEKKPKPKGKKAWKIVGDGGTALAGVMAVKALDSVWKTATGKESPTKPENPEVGTGEAITWAVVSGATVALFKVYTSRRLASYWVKSFGELPPGVQENTDPKDRAKARKQLAKK